MIPIDIVEEIAVEFISKLGLEIGKNGLLKHGNIFPTKTRSQDLYEYFVSQLPAVYDSHKLKYPTAAASFIFNSVFSTDLAAAILKMIRMKTHSDNVANINDTKFNDSIPTPLSKLKMIVNVFSMKQSIIYDTTTEIVYDYDFELITKHLKTLLGDGLGQYLATNSEHCHFAYIPFAPRISMQKHMGINHKTFNLWTPAPWTDGWVPKEDAKLPQVIDNFFKFFIEDEKDRAYFLAWVRDATFGKADPILILCGNPGVGKNIVVQSLLATLVGPDNTHEAPRGFGSQFNSNVGGCRVFFIDEIGLNPTIRDSLKSFHNGKQALEKKGVDVGNPEPIPASFVLANNSKSSIKLEYTDRKFFAPLLSKIPLLDKMPELEITEMVKKITTDIEFIREIASYLYFNFEQGSSKKFKKSKFFEELCIQSYPYYFQRFILMCEHYPVFTKKMFDKNNRVRFEPHELLDKVNEYKTTFKRPLAELKIEGDGSWTATSQICIKQTAKDNESEEGAIL